MQLLEIQKQVSKNNDDVKKVEGNIIEFSLNVFTEFAEIQ